MNIEEIEQLFKSKGLQNKWDKFKTFIRNSIVLSETPINESEIKIGQSKIGGVPDLPDNIPWPVWKNKPLSFLAQINFEETRPYDIEKVLPARGIAGFFYHAKQKTSGGDPKDKGSFRVLYHDGPIDQLKRRTSPDILPKSSIFQPCQLSFKAELSVPNYECSLIDDFFSTDEGDGHDEVDRYCEFLENIYDHINTSSKLLGHSNTIQGAMEIECEWMSLGYTQEYIEAFDEDDFDENDPQYLKSKADALRWRLLLQLDSLDSAKMMWGDTGQLFFWIKDTDLANMNFEDVWMMLQCY